MSTLWACMHAHPAHALTRRRRCTTPAFLQASFLNSPYVIWALGSAAYRLTPPPPPALLATPPRKTLLARTSPTPSPTETRTPKPTPPAHHPPPPAALALAVVLVLSLTVVAADAVRALPTFVHPRSRSQLTPQPGLGAWGSCPPARPPGDDIPLQGFYRSAAQPLPRCALNRQPGLRWSVPPPFPSRPRSRARTAAAEISACTLLTRPRCSLLVRPTPGYGRRWRTTARASCVRTPESWRLESVPAIRVDSGGARRGEGACGGGRAYVVYAPRAGGRRSGRD